MNGVGEAGLLFASHAQGLAENDFWIAFSANGFIMY
jgi:hypothetical protein